MIYTDPSGLLAFFLLLFISFCSVFVCVCSFLIFPVSSLANLECLHERYELGAFLNWNHELSFFFLLHTSFFFTCFCACLTDFLFYHTDINMDYLYKSEIHFSQGSYIFKVLKVSVFYKTRTWDENIYIFFNILKCRFPKTLKKDI